MEFVSNKIICESIINIPKGRLANDAEARARREILRQKLLNGGRVTVNQDGNTMGGDGTDSTIKIPKGKLAVQQWYERDPQLLEIEKIVMNQSFPNFTLGKLDDGRLYWTGKLNIGVYESKFNSPMEYHIMALYQNNHPNQQMGSSVRVYPIMPDVDELIEKCGFRPYHLLTDSDNQPYLCTNEASDQKVGKEVSTAASVIGWAVKWFLSYELVLTGDLDKNDFMTHGRI